VTEDDVKKANEHFEKRSGANVLRHEGGSASADTNRQIKVSHPALTASFKRVITTPRQTPSIKAKLNPKLPSGYSMEAAQVMSSKQKPVLSLCQMNAKSVLI
jgi:hypothetical protein